MTEPDNDDLIDIAFVAHFEEPLFTHLAERLFGEGSRRAHMESLAPSPPRPAGASTPQLQRIRVGAFSGEHLVGWTHGWFEPGRQFYVANSAVLPEFRRRGVYTRLMSALEERLRAEGCVRICSQHQADNSAVLIAKLKSGFVVTGMEFSAEMGLLVKLVRHLLEPHARFHAQRTDAVR
jgi:ribosomal protein S18 acetylase RimI-like enzyme